MKFAMSKDGKPDVTVQEPRVGDVYAAKSTGPRHYRAGTRYFIIVAITPGQFGARSHHLLGLDEQGAVVSTTSYGSHVMKERARLGHCADLSGLSLNIDWERE